jgi:quercetin dioxygenase-like cupin family protein
MGTFRPAFVLVAFAVASLASPLAAQSPAMGPTVHNISHVLNRSDISGVPGKEGVLLAVEWPAGASTGRHTHHGDEFAYVVDGTLELHVDGQPVRVVHAGESYHNAEGVVHETLNLGPATAHTYSFFVVDKGKPLSEPAP